MYSALGVSSVLWVVQCIKGIPSVNLGVGGVQCIRGTLSLLWSTPNALMICLLKASVIVLLSSGASIRLSSLHTVRIIGIIVIVVKYRKAITSQEFI